MRHGADINANNPKNQNTALIITAEIGHFTSSQNYELIDAYAKYGANINAQNNTGKTALMLFIEGHTLHCLNNPEIAEEYIEAFVRNGADINLKDNEGKTILLAVLLNPATRTTGNLHPNTQELLKIFVKHGANLIDTCKYLFANKNETNEQILKVIEKYIIELHSQVT